MNAKHYARLVALPSPGRRPQARRCPRSPSTRRREVGVEARHGLHADAGLSVTVQAGELPGGKPQVEPFRCSSRQRTTESRVLKARMAHQESEQGSPRKEAGVLTAFIKAALQKAHYEILPDGEGYFGAIEGLEGVWAQAATLCACREELQEVLEEWIILGLKMGHPIPSIDGVALTVQEVA